MSAPVTLPVAVRAWAVPDYPLPTGPGGGSDPGPSSWVLVFDTETTTDLGQSLRLVSYELHRGRRLVERGIAYAPGQLGPDEMDLLHAYTARHGLTLRTRESFVDLLYKVTYWQRGVLVGFNLPFDLSRLALRHAPCKPRHGQRSMRGGFTFTLSPDPRLPAIQAKRINARAAFLRFAAPAGRSAEARNRARGGHAGTFRGYVVDVATAAGALLGRRFSLGGLAATLGLAEGKLDIDAEVLGGPVSERLLDYAVRDVAVTWACYRALVDRHAALHLATPLHRLYSCRRSGNSLARRPRNSPLGSGQCLADGASVG